MSFLKHTHKPDYRPDIDGLRAIAVLAVLIYHAGFYWQGEKLLSGGFLGVDIFFVISGYLICGILLKEINAGNFSFISFYERRARRILPVLFFVMLCSAIVAPFLLSTDALQEFTSSVASTAGFVSNFFFYFQDSYTAEPSLRKPLLHTWSLAIEEQFYLLFPLFLWLIWKRASGKYILTLSLVAISSLLYAEWASYYLPSANFYLLPSRIWELLVGAILALMNHKNVCVGGGKHVSLAWHGFALIIASFVMFDDTTRHPSLWTLLPVVGTVMLIMSAPASTSLNKLLSSKLMVSIGLISYSLYLWHQPVFAFARVYTGSELNDWHKFGLIALCFILALLSWLFVETPFRRIGKMSRLQLIRMIGVCLVVFVVFVVVVQLGNIKSVVAAVKKEVPYPICREQRYLSKDGNRCLIYNSLPHKACVFIAGSGEQSWYVVGESTADSLSFPLWQHLRNASLTTLVKGNCPYVPGFSVVRNNKVDCEKYINYKRRKILLESSPSIVVLHSLLHMYIHGSRNRQNLEIITHKFLPRAETATKILREDIRHHVHKAIEELLQHGHTVILVYPIHMADFDIEHRLAELEKIPPDERKGLLVSDRFSKSYQEFRTFADVAYQIYDSLADHPNLIRVLPEKIFCDPTGSGRCKIFDQDVSFYYDFSHLTYYGACKIVSSIFAALPQEFMVNKEIICEPLCE